MVSFRGIAIAMVSAEYLAGFMDGEGYLALGRIPRRESHEYPLRVVVYNTNRNVLERIRQTWGGTMSCSESRKPRWKAQYALIWTNAAAARLLAVAAPYLRVKAKQAVALLEFHARVRNCPRSRDSRGRLLPMSQAEQQFREAVYQHLKLLNARGPRTAPTLASESGAVLREMPSPSPAYLAGFIDGEGSLMINRVKAKGSWKTQYRARIAIGNTYRAVLEDVRRAYGGILVDDPRANPRLDGSISISWSGREEWWRSSSRRSNRTFSSNESRPL